MTQPSSSGTGPNAASDLAAVATIPELADQMRVSRSFVYERVSSGRWPCHRAGYRLFFTSDDIAQIREITRLPWPDQPAAGSAVAGSPRYRRGPRRRSKPRPDSAASG